jgi:hypothetical protein
MSARRIVCAAVLAAAIATAAGTSRADSIFGLYLVGERVEVGDARVTALGGAVQTVDDSLGVLQYNPATLAWMKRFSFGAAGYFTSDKNESEDIDQRSNSTTFSHLVFAFPVFSQRVTAGVGFRGRYDPDGEFVVPGETSEGDPYNDHFERNGGLFSVPITVAFDAGNYAKIGAFFSLERGKIEETWVKDFQTNAADAVSTRERVFKGHCIGGGFVSRPVSQLSIGLTYESQIDYDVDVSERFTNSVSDTSGTESATLPSRMTLSASLRVSRDMTWFLGGSLCDFTDFEGLNFPSGRLAREEVAALGIEYRLADGRFPIRASVRYEQLPYTLPDGEEITSFAFTIGSGKLMKRGRGKLDVALQFADAGSADKNTYQDRSVRFYLSISGSEDWKRERDRRQ